MATNTITITFTPCSPAPANGYNVQYRPTGDTDYRDGGNFTTSPAVVVDINDASGTQYEGYLRGDCGNGIYSPHIPWDTGGGGGGECTALVFTITEITTSSFVVNVTGLVEGETYDISLDNGSTYPLTGLTDNTTLISGLTEDTLYEVIVRRNCESGTALSPEQDVTTTVDDTPTITLDNSPLCRISGTCNDNSTCAIRFGITTTNAPAGSYIVATNTSGSASVTVFDDDPSSGLLDYSEPNAGGTVTFDLRLMASDTITILASQNTITISHQSFWELLSNCE